MARTRIGSNLTIHFQSARDSDSLPISETIEHANLSVGDSGLNARARGNLYIDASSDQININMDRFTVSSGMDPVCISLATAQDRDDLFAWRNDPTTRRNSKNADPVAWETHVAWFADALMSPNRKIYVGYRGIEKIGAVRFDRGDGVENTFQVSIMISPAQRQRGFGKALLFAGIAVLPCAILMAEIASDNLPSRRIFEACGFRLSMADTSGGFLQYRRDPIT